MRSNGSFHLFDEQRHVREDEWAEAVAAVHTALYQLRIGEVCRPVLWRNASKGGRTCRAVSGVLNVLVLSFFRKRAGQEMPSDSAVGRLSPTSAGVQHGIRGTAIYSPAILIGLWARWSPTRSAEASARGGNPGQLPRLTQTRTPNRREALSLPRQHKTAGSTTHRSSFLRRLPTPW